MKMEAKSSSVGKYLPVNTASSQKTSIFIRADVRVSPKAEHYDADCVVWHVFAMYCRQA